MLWVSELRNDYVYHASVFIFSQYAVFEQICKPSLYYIIVQNFRLTFFKLFIQLT